MHNIFTFKNPYLKMGTQYHALQYFYNISTDPSSISQSQCAQLVSMLTLSIAIRSTPPLLLVLDFSLFSIPCKSLSQQLCQLQNICVALCTHLQASCDMVVSPKTQYWDQFYLTYTQYMFQLALQLINKTSLLNSVNALSDPKTTRCN